MLLTVTHRLSLMLLCSLLGVAAVGVSGIVLMTHIEYDLEQTQTRYVPVIEACDHVALAFANVRRASVLYTNAPNDEVRAIAQHQLAEGTAALRDNFTTLQNRTLGQDQEKQYLDQEENITKQYLQLTDQFIHDAEAPGADRVAILSKAPKTLGPIGISLLKVLDAHSKLYDNTINQSISTSKQLYRTSLWTIIVCAIIALSIIGYIGGNLIREIRSRLFRLCAYMDIVSDTLDFSGDIRVTRLDELGKTGKALNKLVSRLRTNLLSIAQSSQSVSAASSQMTSTANQVANVTHQQSDAAAAIAATIEEMTVSVNHVGDKANETRQLVAQVGDMATIGEKAIGHVCQDIMDIAQTVDAAANQIRGLEQLSSEISNVVKVIKEVADQTNLLALNAAIEAARAGEMGRGFAVVADEVRKLAERTSLSTQEITRTVDSMRNSAVVAVSSMENIVGKVSHGVERTQVANDEIARIGQGSRNAVAIVSEIAQAIREQGAATNNIAVQVERIAQMSEENSSAAASSAQLAQNLDQLARTVHHIVSDYKLDGQGRHI